MNSDNRRRKPKKNRAKEVAHTFEWLITAFILALIFRTFVMEAFHIPTGSMAETLNGAHFRLRCMQCGYRYDYGFTPEQYGYPRETVPPGSLRLASRCPSCGYVNTMIDDVENGDRILVLKCIYQFFEPNRWDVVVFNNPVEPQINYIKRLVGKPGETIEIIDGDIYVNGKIARKPSNIQDEMWMVVHNHDYHPAFPAKGVFNNHQGWIPPLQNAEGSRWRTDPNDATRFVLESDPEQVHELVYDANAGNDFRTAYAYNDIDSYDYQPDCSDLKVCFIARGSADYWSGAELSKYGIRYRGWVRRDGFMAIERIDPDGQQSELARRQIEKDALDGPLQIEFANVDHELILKVGNETLRHDLGRDPDSAGPVAPDIKPTVALLGAGKLQIAHIGIYRDTHYTCGKYGRGHDNGNGVSGNPIHLKSDQYFVLGDNSPNSQDGRWWTMPGVRYDGQQYDVDYTGTVPREYMVGKAVFVYWPSGYAFPWPRAMQRAVFKAAQKSKPARILYRLMNIKYIPNVGQMRFIQNGSKLHLTDSQSTNQ